jgi:hypothetical protein
MLRALKVAAFLLLADSVIALLPFSTMIDLSPIGVMGDLMLAEVATLFIIAGILDFSSSIGMAQFRKTFLSSKEDYSTEVRKEKERTAMIFLFTGLVLLAAMILLMVYNLSAYKSG